MVLKHSNNQVSWVGQNHKRPFKMNRSTAVFNPPTRLKRRNCRKKVRPLRRFCCDTETRERLLSSTGNCVFVRNVNVCVVCVKNGSISTGITYKRHTNQFHSISLLFVVCHRHQ